jgi:hypothetical protein
MLTQTDDIRAIDDEDLLIFDAWIAHKLNFLDVR